ncbi:NACHT C-terminal alpha/beta 1 domain-containing protein [Nostoc sp. UHCC 0870]|uniref:NACHT C-terminal alpha/beta 1 domain-containing protein n=1 Tax=Nostoc sp. UHCC 0870 TaxID=2914041 RepID=UPI001EE0816E|nr:hypothetical protein [Nostoc sp. UHCC 0870]UKO98257.1 hypothetical protein L6494_00440 [Nostoc sp. UHCC 0870]
MSNFYLAWHQGNTEEVSLNHLDLPQRLQAVIKNDSQLSQNIHLICIDTSKFIEPDNPANKIYTAIVKAGCPKCSDGTPRTIDISKIVLFCDKRTLKRYFDTEA